MDLRKQYFEYPDQEDPYQLQWYKITLNLRTICEIFSMIYD